jgi:SAM-dependent methyltransferase
MTVLDAGCAMGYFSLPMAKMVGDGGRVICVDMQRRMIANLVRRARRAGVADRIEARVCSPRGLGISDLSDQIDFALAFAVVHEVPDARAFLNDIHGALRQGGRLLIAEPGGHVKSREFEVTVDTARETGFDIENRPAVRRSLTALAVKR